ncbi:sensor histidine kinase [Acidaminobacter sp.]|uniref:sensor histidine kinase n=1 Tax=Acidaminobacter sp. TaxID=1872102 RepID=UPI0025658CA2|nr:HAMP domain-containing sensor histidine kinase [Acidaminobacter sp.]MDK9710750.1 HAMP domain-containing histidine kinase [Acidaminobacter sp.]
MDTKSKNWTNLFRHWLTKTAVILLILAAGLVFSNTLYDEAEGTLFDFDYRSSQAYEELQDPNDWHEAWLADNTQTLILLAVCVMIMLTGLIFLAAVSGRRPDSDDVHFLKTDRIFVDFGLALWIGIQVALVGLAGELLGFANSEWELLMKPVAALFLVLSGALALYAWTLTWKRLKTGTLLSHTFVVWCASKCFGAVSRPIRKALRRLRSGPVDRMPLLIATGFLALNAFTIIFGGLLTATLGVLGFLVGGVVYLSGIALLALYLIRQDQVLARIETSLAAIEAGDLGLPMVPEGPARLKSISTKVNGIAVGYQTALETALKSERMKTELITNVSHDLKTPLTSILNYIDLLKRSGLSAPEAADYLAVLDQKSQRLKTLTEDLFEAAKASSGNLNVQAEPLSLQEFLHQSAGEVRDRMEQASLELKLTTPPQDQPLTIHADGRHLWRIMENLFLNVLKYAMPGSRVYLDLQRSEQNAVITLKNISALPLDDVDDTLTERFVRGDAARTTDGSGLGLAIAKSLAELQKGCFKIETDGDLFKAILTLPLIDA